MKLELYFEAEPFTINQPWGVYDPATYSRFGFDRHNGIDIAHGLSSRLRAPFPYHIVGTKEQPEGGGHVLTIVSANPYDGPDGAPAYVLIDYLHLDSYVKTNGSGDIGDLLAIAGNSGFSTGPHTHIQDRWVRLVDGVWTPFEQNDAHQSFDPMPFYNGKYAANYALGTA